MSGFMKLFGGSKEKAPNAQEAIQKLRETTDMLQKKSEYLEKKIENEVKVAKQHGTKQKRCKRFCFAKLTREIVVEMILYLPECVYLYTSN